VIHQTKIQWVRFIRNDPLGVSLVQNPVASANVLSWSLLSRLFSRRIPVKEIIDEDLTPGE